MGIARQFHCRIVMAMVGGGEGCLGLFADFPLSLAATAGDVNDCPQDDEHSFQNSGCLGAGLGHVCLFAGCLTCQQQASVSQGWICTDNFTCCHTEIEVADQTFYLTQSQYTDTGPTSPSADPITPGAWQGSHWSANV